MTTSWRWSHRDTVTYLAWLDICAESKLVFKKTVGEQLRNSRALLGEEDITFDYSRISNRLSHLAHLSGKKLRMKMIRQKGSAFFTNISGQMREDIKLEKIRLRKAASELIQEQGANTESCREMSDDESDLEAGDMMMSEEPRERATPIRKTKNEDWLPNDAEDNPNSGRFWTEADIVTLIAWLDVCSKTKNIEFNDTFTEQLAQARLYRGEEAYHFNRKQLSNELTKLARQSGRLVSGDNCRKYGSAYFRLLSDDTRKAVRLERSRLRKLASQIMQNTDARPDTLVGGLDDAAYEDGLNSDTPSMETQDEQDDSYRHKQKEIVEDDLNSVVEGTSSPNHKSKYQDMSMGDTIAAKLASEVRSRQLEIADLRRQWQEEIDDLNDQLAKKTEIEIGLRIDLHTIEVARSERRLAGNDRLEDEMADMRNKAFQLTRQVQDLRKQVNFVSKDSVHIAMEIQVKIKTTMDFIGAEVESILHGHDMSQKLKVPNSISSMTDLGVLIQTLMGSKPEGGDEVVYLKKWVSKYDSETLIRSFVAAALREWVFATDFPSFMPAQMGLLNAYRKAVSMHDGWKGLHNLEKIAYNNLIEAPSFQSRTIPKSALEIAIRFSRAVAPLFPKAGSSETNALFETWGEDEAVVKNRRYRLVGIFESALRLKVSTVLTDMQYEFEIVPLGSKQSGQLSLEKPNPEAPDQTQNLKDTEATMLARMHVYDDVYRSDQIDSALLHTKNFVVKKKSDRKASSKLTNELIVAGIGSAPATSNNQSSISNVAKPVTKRKYQRKSQADLTASEDDLEVDDSFGDEIPSPKNRNKDDDFNFTSRKRIGSPVDTSKKTKRQKSSKANREQGCDECREQKIECDGEGTTSCSNCSRSNVECHYPERGDYKCDICEATFFYANSRQRHKERQGCRYCPKCKVTFKLKSDFQQHQFDVHNIGRGAAPSQPPANVDKEHRSWDAQIEIAETSARKSAGRYKQEERREGRGIEGIYLEQDSDSALSDIEIDNGDTGELQSASPNDHQRSFASKFHSSKVAKDFDKSAQKKVEKKKEPESKDSAVIDEGCEHDDEITCNACLRKRKLQALVQRQEDSERKPKKRSSMTVETQA